MSDFTTHYITANRFLKNKGFSEKFQRGFYFGVQGPDIFFFHKPIKGSPVVDFGGALHHVVPKEIVMRGIERVKSGCGEIEKGYFFGFMLHYFGDVNMHPYIGAHTRIDKRKCAHIELEKDIDVLMYEREFVEKVTSFKVKKFYVVDAALVEAIYDFWSHVYPNPQITKAAVEQSANNMVNMSSLFVRANSALIKLVSLVEKGDNKGNFVGHFKRVANEKALNLDKTPYMTSDGEITRSVPEILDKTLSEYEAEYKKIVGAIDGKAYEFTSEKDFDFGCD